MVATDPSAISPVTCRSSLFRRPRRNFTTKERHGEHHSLAIGCSHQNYVRFGKATFLGRRRLIALNAKCSQPASQPIAASFILSHICISGHYQSDLMTLRECAWWNMAFLLSIPAHHHSSLCVEAKKKRGGSCYNTLYALYSNSKISKLAALIKPPFIPSRLLTG